VNLLDGACTVTFIIGTWFYKSMWKVQFFTTRNYTLLQIIFCWFFITTLTYKEKPLYA
jgi:hypothetical protein